MPLLTCCLDTCLPDSSSEPNYNFKKPQHPPYQPFSFQAVSTVCSHPLSSWSAHRTLSPVKPVPNCLPLSMPQVLSTSHHFSCSPLLTSQCEIWVSRCFTEDLEEGGWVEEAELPSFYSCVQHGLPSLGQAQGTSHTAASLVQASTRPQGWPSPALTALLTTKPSWAFWKSPCLSKKPFSVILQEGVCLPISAFKSSTQLSHPLSHTLQLKWETSLW